MNAIYKIIGEDGKEYGPATGEQIRQWITEGRVERQTPIFADGAKDWNFVGLLPEFAGCFTASDTPPIGTQKPGTSTAGQLPKTNPFATAGLVCGILSLTLCWCCGGLPFNILGLIFSMVALDQINKRPELHEGRGLARAGIILPIISFLIFLALFLSGHIHGHFHAGRFQ